MKDKCPVCGSSLKVHDADSGGRDATTFECPQCGKFTLTNSLVASLPSLFEGASDGSAKLSHAIRRAQARGECVEFSTYTVTAALRQPLPRPKEQADLLVRWLAENVAGPGEPAWLTPKMHSAVIGAKTPAGFNLILDYLYEKGLITGPRAKTIGEAGGGAHASLSLDGWELYESLQQGSAVYRKAFMAMKFGDSQLDAVVEAIFRPCTRQAGFTLLRLDDVPRAGLIDNRLRVEIQSSDFVVADLTHDNPGAYWEAGYAEGLGKPVIYTCEKQKFDTAKTHFDTNHHLTIVWDANSPESAGEDLKATIRATLPHLAKQRDED
jgi:hypothetical protein